MKTLLTLLEGESLAQVVEQKDYKVAKAKTLERMGPVQFVSMDDFHRHRLQPITGLIWGYNIYKDVKIQQSYK